MTPIGPAGRLAASVVAVVGWFALGLQFVLLFQTTAAAGGTTAGAVLTFFSFFTILSNTIVATAMTRIVLGRPPGASALGAATLYIAVVGITYSLALRHIWDPQGWQKVADRMLHDLMPLLAVLFWWVFIPRGTLQWRMIPAWLAFPLVYFGYSLLRGAIDGWYPYYFIDAVRLGYPATLRNAAIVTALFAALAATMVGLDRRLGRNRH